MNEFERRRLEEVRAFEHRMEILRLNGLKQEDTEPVVKILMDNLEKIKEEESKAIKETQVEVESFEMAAQVGVDSQPANEQVLAKPSDPPAPEKVELPETTKPIIHSDLDKPSVPAHSAQAPEPRPQDQVAQNVNEPATASPAPLELEENKETPPTPQIEIKLGQQSTSATQDPQPLAETSAPKTAEQPQPEPVIVQQAKPAPVEPPQAPVEKATQTASEPAEIQAPTPAPAGLPQPTPEVIPADAAPEQPSLEIKQQTEPQAQSDMPVAPKPQDPPQPTNLPEPPKGGIKQMAEQRSQPAPAKPPQTPPSPAQLFEEAGGRIEALSQAVGFDTLKSWRAMNLAMAMSDDTRVQYGSAPPNTMPSGDPRSIRQGQTNLATAFDAAANDLGEFLIAVAQAISSLNKRMNVAERILDEGSV